MKFQINIDFKIEPEYTNKMNNALKYNLKRALIEYSMTLRMDHPLQYENIESIDVHKISEDKHS